MDVGVLEGCRLFCRRSVHISLKMVTFDGRKWSYVCSCTKCLLESVGISREGMNESWKSHLLRGRVVLPHMRRSGPENPNEWPKEKMGFVKTELYYRMVCGAPHPPNRTKIGTVWELSTSRYWVDDKHSDIFLQRMNYVRENFLKRIPAKELAKSCMGECVEGFK